MKLVILALLSAISFVFPIEFYGETRIFWNIPVTVLVYAEKNARKLVNDSFAEIRRVAHTLNRYSEESEVSKINRNAGKRPIKVSDRTLEVIDRAVRISELTEGAFDISVAPLVSLWDFRKKKIPLKKDIVKTLKKVGFRHIRIDRKSGTVFLERKGMGIDLGGLIKGYLADIAVDLLKREGAVAGLVSLGGDVRIFGRKPDGRKWKIGVKHPRREGVIAVVEIQEGAVSTSGDYERYFIYKGTRYHHIIDPRTGYPARGFQSVTVFAKEGIMADALSTALFVLGSEKALQKIRELGVEAILIDSKGKVFVTEGLRERTTLLNP